MTFIYPIIRNCESNFVFLILRCFFVIFQVIQSLYMNPHKHSPLHSLKLHELLCLPYPFGHLSASVSLRVQYLYLLESCALIYAVVDGIMSWTFISPRTTRIPKIKSLGFEPYHHFVYLISLLFQCTPLYLIYVFRNRTNFDIWTLSSGSSFYL